MAFDGLISLLRRLEALGLFDRKGPGLRLGRIVNAIKELGPAGPEPMAIVALARGEKEGRPARARVALRGPSDYGVTAMSAVAFARLVAARRDEVAGAGHPRRLFHLREVIDTIDHPDLEVLESDRMEPGRLVLRV